MIDRAWNQAEPPVDECPPRVRFGDETYRRRIQTPNTLGTLFGPINVWRCIYECLEPGEPCIAPLELQWGVVAGLATPALAERVGRWSAEHPQQAVLALLEAEHGVHWSVDSLRKVTRGVRDGVKGPGEKARQDRMIELLVEAEKSPGKHRPTLAVGRDGVMIPIRGQGYQEAATGTVSVHDRRGKRLGTIYLAEMPEPGQPRLTKQMTAMITAVIATWHAMGQLCPRLAYLTDGGHHQQQFFRQVLAKMKDPWRPGQKLMWQWTIDFFHACEHLWKMAESLFGASSPAAWAWYRRTRHWLRHRRSGIADILRSATQHFNRRKLSASRQEAFAAAYGYLGRHARWMDYAANKRQRLPIGSGVTEAACKTVFTQRLKCSGMTWAIEGGQVIVDLRVLVLSGVWDRTYAAHLKNKPTPQPASHQPRIQETSRIAA